MIGYGSFLKRLGAIKHRKTSTRKSNVFMWAYIRKSAPCAIPRDGLYIIR